MISATIPTRNPGPTPGIGHNTLTKNLANDVAELQIFLTLLFALAKDLRLQIIFRRFKLAELEIGAL